MLEQARVRALEEGVELDLREEDIRELAVEEPAGLIYCPGRSLLHHDDSREYVFVARR